MPPMEKFSVAKLYDDGGAQTKLSSMAQLIKEILQRELPETDSCIKLQDLIKEVANIQKKDPDKIGVQVREAANKVATLLTVDTGTGRRTFVSKKIGA